MNNIIIIMMIKNHSRLIGGLNDDDNDNRGDNLL